MTPLKRKAIARAIRDRLKQDKGLASYFAENYPERPVSFRIGLKPDIETFTAMPIDRFPYIAISVASGNRAAQSKDRRIQVSIMYGVHDDRIEDGEALGVTSIIDLSELIEDALYEQPIGLSKWDGAAEFRNEAGLNPYNFHEGETLITLEYRA